MEVRLSELIAPQFYDIHWDIIEGKHTHYKLYGGRGSTKSSFVSIEIIMGTDILKSSLPTGMTPILFSVGGVLSGLFSIVLLSFSFARVNVCELKLSES